MRPEEPKGHLDAVLPASLEDGPNDGYAVASYLTALSSRLPAHIVDELADGLAESHQAQLRRGLAPDQAAEAAIAEFGTPEAIAAAFARTHPARITAVRLLRVGPVVGGCWAAALITSHAWDWPVPAPARVFVGLALIVTIGLIAAAARSPGYRFAARTAVAACAATTALDTLMIGGVVVITSPAVTWLIMTAMAASAARIGLAAPRLIPARPR